MGADYEGRAVSAVWVVLDNLRNGWPHRTNLTEAEADAAYGYCQEKGYVKDGKITPAGEVVLITNNFTGLNEGR